MKKNVLIIRMGALGDTVVCLPCLLALRTRYNVYFLGRMPGISFLAHFVDNVYNIEESRFAWIFNEKPKANSQIFPNLDYIVVFMKDRNNTVKRNLQNAFQSQNISVFASLPVGSEKQLHIVKYIYMKLREADLEVSWHDVASIIKRGIYKYSLDHPYVLYHLGSGSSKKNLDISLWFKIKKDLCTAFPEKRHLLICGPDEMEMKSCLQKLALESSETLNWILEPVELLAILQQAYLFIGHDSGPTHLSALLGIPTVSFFKTGSVKVWRPVGRCVKVLKINKEKDPASVLAKTIPKLFQGRYLLLP